jgi:carboxyl-terminal processing protease
LNLLKSSDIQGLLVDIRGAAGGDVRVAVSVADLFLPENSPVLLLQKRDGEKDEFLAASEALLTETPVTVLLDGGSSGPAEVFAAALTDNNVAATVGERSNGRGSIQDEYRMEDGSVLIISTHILYRPDGEPLQRKELRNSGIVPDVRSPAPDFVTSFYFENTPEESEGDPGEDFYQRLDRAIEEEQMKEGIRQLEERIRGSETGKKEAA